MLANPGARQLRDELRAVCAALEPIQPEEPPRRGSASGSSPRCPEAAKSARSRRWILVAALPRLEAALRGRIRRRLARQRAGIPFGSSRLGPASVDQLVGTMARVVPESVDLQGGGLVKATIELPRSAVLSACTARRRRP